MAGQQALHNFLQQPAPGAPGKADVTGILPPQAGKGSPRQQAARQNQADAQKAEQHQLSVARQQQQLAAGEERRAARAMQQQQQLADREAKQAQNAIKALGGVGEGVGEGISSLGDRLAAFGERVPTPGGIALILVAIFVFLWAIVPVNGSHTRLELLWLTFTGRTSMASAPEGGQDVPPSSGEGIGNAPPAALLNGNSSATSDIFSAWPALDMEDF